MKVEEEKPSWAYRYWKVLFWEAILFSLTLGLGMISTLKTIQLEQSEVIPFASPVSPWQFILSFFLTLLIILLVIKFVKFRLGKKILFKSLYIVTISIGSFFSLAPWIGDFSLILILILLYYWVKKPNILVHNILLITGVAGAGIILGLRMEPLLVVFLLIIFSIYDIVAVYKTKHMIKMAKEMIEARAIPGLILPPKFSELGSSLKGLKMGGRFVILGSGDIVFPLLFVVSLVPYGILDSIIVAIFAIIGLLVSFLIFALQKTRKPIPALPPIATLSIIGYLITLIFDILK